ncbi:flagellar protein FlgN [Xylanimonas oleitrophica]|uniref:Flagellar protein FlgN n=1 Tax=Xylanimonas oleitrophica TaxID=2607479 RepID=A0A2W5YGZ8_9MICO|nr:flagellar protein FlgN [Xylanimonas oleitrophica]
MTLSTLSETLWAERRLLEMLRFRLEVHELVLASGRLHALAQAGRELSRTLDAVHTADLGRAVDSDGAATELGLAPGASLGEITAAAPPPWSDMLQAHHHALTELVTDIRRLADRNQQLLQDSAPAAGAERDDAR